MTGQETLIIGGLILGGLVVGVLFGFMVLRLRRRSAPKRVEIPAVKASAPSLDPLAELVKKHRETAATLKRLRQSISEDEHVKSTNERPMAVAPVKQSDPVAPAIFREARDNLAIASRPWTGEMSPFQTSVWDGHKNDVNLLPAEAKEALGQAYIDARLANSIVWLSMEVGRRSQELDQGYIKLCGQIKTRLDKALAAAKERV